MQSAKVIEAALEPGEALRLNSPAGTYRTADGWIAITLTREPHFRKLCEALEMPELAADPRFESFATRAAHHDALVPPLSERVATRSTDAWIETLHAHDVLAERVLTHGDWLAEEVRQRARSLEERLARIEKHVTSRRYQLDEEFRNL